MSTKRITISELKRLVKKVINEDHDLSTDHEPAWRESDRGEPADLYITMSDGIEMPFHFLEDDGGGTSYHASDEGGKGTLTFVSDDGMHEAIFTAYSTTGNPDNPDYQDLELVKVRHRKGTINEGGFHDPHYSVDEETQSKFQSVCQNIIDANSKEGPFGEDDFLDIIARMAKYYYDDITAEDRYYKYHDNRDIYENKKGKR